MITLIGYFVLYSIVEAVHDWAVLMWAQELSKLRGSKIERYSEIWHRASATLAVMLACLPAVLVMYWQDIDPVLIFLLVLCIRWVVLDLVLNIMRGLPWVYVGTTSTIDRALHWTRHPEAVMIGLKVIAIAVLVYFSIFGLI